MVSSFSVSVRLNIPRDLLWRVRATKTFMQFLVSNGALNRMDSTSALPTHDTPSSKTRTQTYVPAAITVPDIVKPVFDDSYIEIKDVQTWDDAVPFVQNFNIKPAIMADVVKSTGSLTIDELPHGDGCMHTLAGECIVAIPFLGWYIEQAIISNMKDFYADYSRHIDEFMDMMVERFGDGTMDSLTVAVDRLCAEEKNY